MRHLNFLIFNIFLKFFKGSHLSTTIKKAEIFKSLNVARMPLLICIFTNKNIFCINNSFLCRLENTKKKFSHRRPC